MDLATFPLLPIERLENGEVRCGCGDAGCKRIGKHPAYAWSQVGKGERVIAPPGYGVGICTGERSGIVVLDVDGPEAAKALAALGPIPETYTVRTGRGLHFYFQWPGYRVRTHQGELAPGLDIRGDGGIVVAPGSPHKSGAVYTVLDSREPAEVPAWLLEWPGFCDKTPAIGPVESIAIDPTHPEWSRRLELAKVRCLEAPPAVDGANGSGALWDVALYLVRTLELPQDTACQAIEAHYNPRCLPAWTQGEIAHKVISARVKSSRITGISTDGFIDRLLATPLDRASMAPPSNTVMRRVADPMHEYKHKPFDAPSENSGKIPLNTAILILCTHEDWSGVWQWDCFRKRVVAVNAPMPLDCEKDDGTLTPRDLAVIRTWFISQGGIVAKDDFWDAVTLAAHEAEFHTIKEQYE